MKSGGDASDKKKRKKHEQLWEIEAEDFLQLQQDQEEDQKEDREETVFFLLLSFSCFFCFSFGLF